METYFYMDHARKACVTPGPNLVTESQKYSKLRDFWEKWVTFGELFCEETFYVSVDFFVKILTREHEKDLQLIWSLKYNMML